MNDVIIYGGHYGSAQKYAQNLAQKINVQYISFKDVKDINEYRNIIYIGSLYAGGVVGLKKSFAKVKDIKNKKFIIATVGLADPTCENNISHIRKSIKSQISNEIFESARIFNLRGDIDYSKLSKLHGIMMSFMYRKIIKIPQEKRTPQDREFIDTYKKKVEFVDFDSLNKIVKAFV